jgi:serine/threonine protein kinase
MAPELFQKRQYDEKVDVFAFGALLWEIVMREVPFDGLDAADIRAKVEKGEQLKLPYNIDPRVGQLVNECR